MTVRSWYAHHRTRRDPWPDLDRWGKPFFGRHYVLLGDHLAFVAIPKNAITFLKRAALLQHDGRWRTTLRETHHDLPIGGGGHKALTVPFERMAEFEREHGPRHKFAAWRDPIKRIESVYSLFVLDRSPHVSFDYFGLRDNPSPERFMQYLRWSFGHSDPLLVNEHIRRQCEFYDLDDVHDIVSTRDLFDYLDFHGVPYVRERSNESRFSYSFTDADFLAYARGYYAADYALASHLWSPARDRDVRAQ